jgi:hypothetical protein
VRIERLVRLLIKHKHLKPSVSSYFGIDKRGYTLAQATDLLAKYKKYFTVQDLTLSDEEGMVLETEISPVD